METKKTEIFERISKTLDLLRVKAPQFSKTLGYERAQTIYDIINGKSAPSYDFFNRLFNSEYSEMLNLNWIITGKGDIRAVKSGEMVLNEPQQTYNLRTDHSLLDQLIPLYNLSATASLSSVFTHTDENTLGMIQIPNLPKCDGAITITGDSMYPLLKSGDMVIYKNVPDPLTAIIFYGEMYLLSFVINEDEFIAVKWIQRSDQKDHIKLVSENTHHDPVEIPKTSIKALALIKASVRVNSMR